MAVFDFQKSMLSVAVVLEMKQYKLERYDYSGTELRSCVKVNVAVLGSPSLVVHRVSVDIKQH